MGAITFGCSSDAESTAAPIPEKRMTAAIAPHNAGLGMPIAHSATPIKMPKLAISGSTEEQRSCHIETRLVERLTRAANFALRMRRAAQSRRSQYWRRICQAVGDFFASHMKFRRLKSTLQQLIV
jgi:hypothetical protein